MEGETIQDGWKYSKTLLTTSIQTQLNILKRLEDTLGHL